MKKRNGFRKYGLILMIVSFVFTYGLTLVEACDCEIPETVEKAVEQAAAVFTGKVIDKKEATINGEKYDVVLLEVMESWKGVSTTQVKVYSDWSSCNFHFEVGKEYLLYPFDYGGMLRVMDCGRSGEISRVQEDLLELGDGEVPLEEVVLEDDFHGREKSWMTNTIVGVGVGLLALLILFALKKDED